ncbi:peptidase [Pilimelia anulata]|uniref:Peptidase n=1 Tax=Pilimelia anulata TaxID=53371 RepID=A0A8J3F7J5_9ACTN|nr:alpha/beta hydrolase [Pilimelia anulata]GGJ79189.1 peptidase [Pilimelia anulata]
MRKFVSSACAAVVALAGTALVAPATATAAPAPAAAIDWQPCTDATLSRAGAECGYVDVPLDHAKPAGEKIQIAVSRVKHKVADADYQGPILVNPGGPGGSGLRWATLGARVPNKIGEAYDWIGFDPRGVGASKPALSCDPEYFTYNRPEYAPGTPEIEKANLAKAAGYTKKCAASPAAKLLDHVKTTDTVRDMELIRAALGAEKINYYGFSYGTYIAQVYATLFPERLRRVVIDGVVDHRDVWYKANLNQDVNFERNIQIFFSWIGRNDKVFHLGTSGGAVSKLYYKTKAELAKKPAGGLIGSSEFNDLFLPAGYSQGAWNSIAKAFSLWVTKQDAKAIKDAYDAANGPGDDNLFAIYLATQCTDIQWPTEWQTWRKDNWATNKKAPFYTWANAWFNAPCYTWPGKAGTPVVVDPAKAPPVLIVTEELDAATPINGALEARRILPGSALINSTGGTTHSSSLRGNACVDSPIAEYLRSGTLPKRQPGAGADLVCKAPKKPTASTTALAPADPYAVPFRY